MQDPVAERGDLVAGQRRHVREADQLGPDQVSGGEHGLQPGAIFLLAPAGQVPQARCLRPPDAVLDPGMLALSQFQPGDLAGDPAAAGVGDERGDAVLSTSAKVGWAPAWEHSLRGLRS